MRGVGVPTAKIRARASGGYGCQIVAVAMLGESYGGGRARHGPINTIIFGLLFHLSFHGDAADADKETDNLMSFVFGLPYL